MSTYERGCALRRARNSCTNCSVRTFRPFQLDVASYVTARNTIRSSNSLSVILMSEQSAADRLMNVLSLNRRESPG